MSCSFLLSHFTRCTHYEIGISLATHKSYHRDRTEKLKLLTTFCCELDRLCGEHSTTEEHCYAEL
jgi:hypothetical protein